MVVKKKTPYFSDIVKYGWKLTVKAISDGIKPILQENKYLRFITDVYGFGLDGGPIDSKVTPEIIVRGNDILGFRNYDKRNEKPLERIEEIIFDPTGMEIEGYKTGERIHIPSYDGNFDSWGSAWRLTNGDYEDLNDKTAMRQMFVNNALRYYVTYGQRRPILNWHGERTGIDVIDIPRTEGFLGGFKEGGIKKGLHNLTEGFDWGLAKYNLFFSILYGFLDNVIFDPIVERPVRAFNKRSKKLKLPLEPFMLSEVSAVESLVNSLYGVTQTNYIHEL